MSLDLFPKKERREPIELQLTAMIDVFSMIVIFLIFGTVFGAADMVIPPGMEIPKSMSKEGIESAPRLVIEKNKVGISLLNETFGIEQFRNPAARAALKEKLKPALTAFQNKKKENKEVVAPLNLVADRDTPYSTIFDVVVVFRELGFNTILFVANAGGKSK